MTDGVRSVAGKQVLIVDDRADVRRLVRWSLGALEDRVHVHEAANGDTALRLAYELQADLVLLDVTMPGELDGLTVCRRIRQDPQLARTRVVLISSHGRVQDVQSGIEAGAHAYIVKPFTPQRLLETARKLLA